MLVCFGTNRYGSVIVADTDAVRCTELLPIEIGRPDLDRCARPCSKHTPERPAAECASQQPRLPLEEGRLVYQEHVVRELAVEALSSVTLAQIVGIVNSEPADGLVDRCRPQCFGPGEVRLHG